MNDTIIEVNKRELHFWPQCPCPACAAERERRAHVTSHTASTPIRTIPFNVAYTIGVVSRRNPCGSLAKQLMQERGDG